MARPRNRNKTARLNLSTSQAVVAYLNDLVDLGLHGSSPTEAAERLVETEIKHLIETGYLRARRPVTGGRAKVG